MTGETRAGRPAPRLLVTSYLVGALVWWLVAAVASLWALPELARGAVAGQTALLAVHLLGLGFLPLAVVGASLHVLPLLLRTRASPGRGWLALPLLLAGPLLAWGISRGQIALARPAAAAVVSALAVVGYEVAVVVAGAPRDRVLLAGRLGVTLALAHAALALAVGAALLERPGGELVGAGFGRGMLVHLHLAAVGWLTLLILAVGRTLAPMLALAPAAPRRRLPAEEVGLAVGLWVLVAGLLAGWELLSAAGGGLVVAALARFGLLLARVTRGHRGQGMEGPLGHFLVGLLFLAQAAALGLAMLLGWEAIPRRLAAYALLLLVGWAAGVTVGHAGKLLALSLWSGWPPGPRPRQEALYPRRLWGWEVALFASGIEVASVALLVGSPGPAAVGAALLVGSAGLALAGALVTLAGLRLRPERHPEAFPGRANGRRQRRGRRPPWYTWRP